MSAEILVGAHWVVVDGFIIICDQQKMLIDGLFPRSFPVLSHLFKQVEFVGSHLNLSRERI